MYCPKCGVELDANASFCPTCGENLNPTASTAANTTVNAGNQAVPPRPENYLVWAILCTILCCLPLGIVSIIYAADVNSKYDRGDYRGAETASRKAKSWAVWGAIIAAIYYVLSAIFFVLFGFGVAMLEV